MRSTDSAAIAELIDHTALGFDVDAARVERLCREAVDYGFQTVCISSCWVGAAAGLLSGTKPRVCSTAGFPFGSNSTQAKASEAAGAVKDGAAEVDMVLNIGLLKSGRWDDVKFDIEKTVASAKSSGSGVVVKVIIEACLLSDDEKTRASVMIREGGADFVKTSTGYAAAGATIEDIVLIRRAVGEDFGVKASGGIKTLEALLALRAAGANRIGTSSGAAILEELKRGR